MTASYHGISRRGALLAGGAALLAPLVARAQTRKTISLVCAFPAGSGADVLVRFYAEKLQSVTGQTVIVDNRTGAAGNIAAEHTMRAAPDGSTLLIHSGNSLAGNVWLMKNPPLNPAVDLRTVALLHDLSFLFVVRADSPYQSVDDLVADQKAKGDAGSYATSTVSGIVMTEEFKQLAGIETQMIRYTATAESVNDLLAGHVDFGSYDPAFSLAQQNAGRMRILASCHPTRVPGMPDVPTLTELGYDISQPGWWGVIAPKDLPDDLAQEINAQFLQVLEDPETRAFIEQAGSSVRTSTVEEAQNMMEKSIVEWKRLVQISGIEPT